MTQQEWNRMDELSDKLSRLAIENGHPCSTNVDDLPAAEAKEWRGLLTKLPELEFIPHSSQNLSCFI